MNRVISQLSIALALMLLLPVGAMAQEPPAENPISDVALDMGAVVQQLSRLNTRKPTQDVQKEIIVKLDRLIEELDKQCAACRGSQAAANPTKPAADSIIRSGPGGQSSLHAAKSGTKKWGELPPHQRDRILQSQTEGFPVHYQQILERYYRRLAEERPADPEAAAPKPRAAASSLQSNPTAPVKNGNQQ